MKNRKLKIDLTKKYFVSRSVNISVSDQGEFVIYNSLSRPFKHLNIDHLLILNTFLKPITFQEAYIILNKIYNLSKSELKIIVTQLLNLNIITADQTIPSVVSTSNTGFASLGMHHFMVRDTVRVMAYKSAIMSEVTGKTVIDLGCGTGILSLFAAKAGATNVTAIEESNISAIAEQMFKANNVGNLITLKKSNSRDVNIDQRVDVLIHEIIGMDPLDENILTYILDAKKRFLKENGILIPNRMEICCIGYEEDTLDYFIREAEAFTELYGLSFVPYADSIKKTSIEQLSKYMDYRDREFGRRKEISKETILYDIDFRKDFRKVTQGKKQVSLKILRDGILSGVLVYFKAYLTDDIVLSTSPFNKPTHWGQKNTSFSIPLKVQKNVAVRLSSEIITENGKQKINVCVK